MKINQNFIIFVLLLGLVLFGLTLGTAQAQNPTPSDDEVNAIAKQLYCPVCENIPLDVCPTQACAQWRDLIREKLAAGWSEQQIKDYFAAQYGDRVLAQPPRRGLNWMVYILPPLFFMVGAYLVYRALRSRSRKLVGAAENLAMLDPNQDPYVSKLEAELEERLRKGE